MKKITAIILTLMLTIIALSGCGDDKDPKEVIAGYTDSQTFEDGEDGNKQEFTKYTYDKSFDEKFSSNEDYIMVDSKTKDEITGYINNFDEWATISTFSKDYDFGADKVKDGDYYVIADKTISNDNIGVRKQRTVYKMYSIFYYQTESHTLYHIYSDITS